MTRCCCCPNNEQTTGYAPPAFNPSPTGPNVPGIGDDIFGELHSGIPENGLFPEAPCVKNEDAYDDEINEGGDPSTAPVPPPVFTTQYSPSFSAISGKSSGDCIQANTALYARHDPDGISGVTWSTWDGITRFNPCALTKAQLYAAIWPTGDCRNMLGLRDLYYSINPFADVANPTIAEIDAWHAIVVNHYRDLLGIATPILNDANLYVRAQWASERKNTTYWDTSYPTGELCPTGSSTHCGWTFIPSCLDQAPYLAPGQGCVASTPQSEGIFGALPNPWSVRFACVLAKIVQTEGITGHGGPFLGRPNMGMNFWCNGSETSLRIKFNGVPVNPCPPV